MAGSAPAPVPRGWRQVSFASQGGSGTPVPDLSIEVDDLDEALRRVREGKVPLVYGPVSEPWGVRRFYVREPLVALPLTQDQATVLCRRGREVYTAYVPTDKGPVFMRLIERAFGRDVTTRTIETVARCAAA